MSDESDTPSEEPAAAASEPVDRPDERPQSTEEWVQKRGEPEDYETR